MERLPIVLIVLVLTAAGCGSTEAPDPHAGPKKAIAEWISMYEKLDYGVMFDLFPMQTREILRVSWEKEKEAIAKASPGARKAMLEGYGFKNLDELKACSCREHFARSMARFGKGGVPAKIRMLKEATVDTVSYDENRLSCKVTFKDADGSPLPLTMILIKEGHSWKVGRLP